MCLSSGNIVMVQTLCVVDYYSLIMPPTLEKLKGHIAFGLSVRPSVRPSVLSKFIKIQF